MDSIASGLQFLNTGYTIAFKDEQVCLCKVKNNLNKFVFIAYNFYGVRCFSNADTSYVFHVLQNVEDIYLILK